MCTSGHVRTAKRAWRAVGGVRDRLPGGVALSFDDGPDPVFTPMVLAVLEDKGVNATFFCVGRRAERHPELVSALLDAGHQVGSHSYSHPRAHLLSVRDRYEDYRSGRDALEQVAGRTVRLFRPPAGHLGVVGPALVRALGVRTWSWSNDPKDYKPGCTSAAIFEVAASASPGDVVLLHDGLEDPRSESALDRSATVLALPAIIDELRARELDFRLLPA